MIIGIGIDIVDIERIKALINKYDMRFLTRIFSDEEIEYCKKRVDMSSGIAARFAVKEAAVKALTAGISSGIHYKDICIEMKNGAPNLLLSGKAQELSKTKGALRNHVSISHDKGLAVAVVILESA